MHIYFSGIGGAGIGPLALIAAQSGHKVSGSDKQSSAYISYLEDRGIKDIHVGQTYAQIEAVHQKNPIDWYVYSSAVTLENPDADELRYCRQNNIRTSKRDELLNHILIDKKLDLVAVAGTHGKTTTTAMVTWLFKQLDIPISNLLGAKIDFGEMGHFDEQSKYFVYEADEFDRNFLAFEPELSLISGVSWDHHEIFPTRENYIKAFVKFIKQSRFSILWQTDTSYLGLSKQSNMSIETADDQRINSIKLKGYYNRLDAWLAVVALHKLTDTPVAKLITLINDFPGLKRRMEEILPNLYSDYAHTPEKIRGAMSQAMEIAADHHQEIVVIYEPLTNRRQHYIINDYKDCFSGAKQVYWLPSYLAREDPTQPLLSADELISRLSDPAIAKPHKRDDALRVIIEAHLSKGHMVLCMAGGGGDSLDDWVRENFS